MIKEEYVQHDTAKLLKDAGYPQDYATDYYSVETGRYQDEYGFPAKKGYPVYKRIAKPTQALAKRWLREVHHINIRVNWHSTRQQWFFDMLNIDFIYDYFESEDYFPTYEAAFESAVTNAIRIIKSD